MATRFVTPVFRVSFPSVFEASSYDGGPAKFSVSAIWDEDRFTAKEKKQWKQIKDALDEACVDRFKKKMDDLPGNFKKALRDGAEKADLEGYGDGMTFANLSSKMKPGIIDMSSREPITDPSDFYPGCYARATVTVYTYDNKGKGVALGLQNLMFVAEGERLDSRTDAGDDFEDEDMEDDRFSDPLDD